MRSRRRVELHLVDEAPTPILAGFETAHHSMGRMLVVLRRMLVRRIVATADVPAEEAKPQMHPVGPIFQAFLAPVRSTRLHIMDLIEMRSRLLKRARCNGRQRIA